MNEKLKRANLGARVVPGLVCVLLAGAAAAAEWKGGGPDNNWTNAENWVDGVLPTVSTLANIGTANYRIRTAVVTQPGAVCVRLHLARVANTTGELEILDGDLTAGSQQSDWGHSGGKALVTMRGGSLTVGNLMSGECIVTQVAGVVTLSGIFGNVSGYHSRYVLKGGELFAPATIANGGMATIEQSDGTNTLSGTTYLAKGTGGGTPSYATCHYTLSGGVLNLAGGTAVFGGGGSGQFGSGTLHLGGGNVASLNGSSLTVRNQAGAYGRIRGWGRLDGLGTLTMNGQTIADGAGADRSLIFTFNTLANGIANGAEGTNGWFAVGGGLLELPAIAVNASGAKVWGDTAAAALDLVNAVAFDFSGVTGSGTLTGALCAPGRADAPRRVSTSKIIGLWHFVCDGFSSSATSVTVRYDQTASAALNIEEEGLRLYIHSGQPDGKWLPLASTVDTLNRKLIATGLTASSFYLAAGSDVSSAFKGTTLIVR